MVGHDIEQMPHLPLPEGGNPGPVIGIAADLGIQPRRIGDVIAVRTAGHGNEVRGGVAIGDAQRMQVIDDASGIAKREPIVELQAVCCERNSCGGHDLRSIASRTPHSDHEVPGSRFPVRGSWVHSILLFRLLADGLLSQTLCKRLPARRMRPRLPAPKIKSGS